MLRYANAPRHEGYDLSTINVIGGSAKLLQFLAYEDKTDDPFDLSRCTANFAVTDHLNKHGEPIISKEMTVTQGDSEGEGLYVNNLLEVTLDTEDLEGKFVYQITVKDEKGVTEIPAQGVMYVRTNIDKDYANS